MSIKNKLARLLHDYRVPLVGGKFRIPTDLPQAATILADVCKLIISCEAEKGVASVGTQTATYTGNLDSLGNWQITFVWDGVLGDWRVSHGKRVR